MTTAGGLVFQGQADGLINAYDARDGRKLWSFDAHMGISGAPDHVSRRRTTVRRGRGGVGRFGAGILRLADGAARLGSTRASAPVARLCARRQGVVASTPPPSIAQPIDDPGFVVDADKASAGARIFAGRCTVCHGLGAVAAGYAPDLRASPIPLNANTFDGRRQGRVARSARHAALRRARQRRARCAAALPACTRPRRPVIARSLCHARPLGARSAMRAQNVKLKSSCQRS